MVKRKDRQRGPELEAQRKHKDPTFHCVFHGLAVFEGMCYG